MTYSKNTLSEGNKNGEDPIVENNTDKLSNKITDGNLELFILILKLKLDNLLSQVSLSTVDLFDKLNLSLLVQDFKWSKNSTMIMNALLGDNKVVFIVNIRISSVLISETCIQRLGFISDDEIKFSITLATNLIKKNCKLFYSLKIVIGINLFFSYNYAWGVTLWSIS